MDAFLLDLDGTLYVGERPLAGAVEAVRSLERRGIPCRYLTNTTRVSRRALADRLRRMGFDIGAEEIFTAPLAAAAWLKGRGLRRVSLLLPVATREDFPDFEVTEESPEAVVVGDLGEAWSFDRLNAAFRHLREGAVLVALQKNRYWRDGEGLTLDAGPFVAALEYAAGVTAEVVGKPSSAFFHAAADALGVERSRVTVVGDDVESDAGGAVRAGLRAVLVRTGKYSDAALAAAAVAPHAVVADVGEAVGG